MCLVFFPLLGCASPHTYSTPQLSPPQPQAHVDQESILQPLHEEELPQQARHERSVILTALASEESNLRWRLDRLPATDSSVASALQGDLLAQEQISLFDDNRNQVSVIDATTPLSLFDEIAYDHMHFYSFDRLRDLTLGAAGAAALANTAADENLRETFLVNITNVGVGEYAEEIHKAKFIGDGWYTIPMFAGAAITGRMFQDVPMITVGGEWGERSLRTILVGGPPLLGLQYLLGASRPDETHEGSEWQPFEDNNGVSGHSFMGAVPFLSAAKMTDEPYLKAMFYVASTLPGLSRITDDDHYPSQVLLGWWIAYLASSAVDDTQQLSQDVTVFPWLARDGVGVGVEVRR